MSKGILFLGNRVKLFFDVFEGYDVNILPVIY